MAPNFVAGLNQIFYKNFMFYFFIFLFFFNFSSELPLFGLSLLPAKCTPR